MFMNQLFLVKVNFEKNFEKKVFAYKCGYLIINIELVLLEYTGYVHFIKEYNKI